jgi:hypothetical protein
MRERVNTMELGLAVKTMVLRHRDTTMTTTAEAEINEGPIPQTDLLPGRVIGLYIDMSWATSIAGTRLCLVRTLPDGSLHLAPLELIDGIPDNGPPAGMTVPNLTPADLAVVVNALWS